MKSSTIIDILAEVPYLDIPDELILDLRKFDDLDYVNGCGAAQGISSSAPNNIGASLILAACIKHDTNYYYGETHDDKVDADISFLIDLLLIISKSPGFMTMGAGDRQLMIDKAVVYYRFVNEYGLKSFVEGKQMSITKVSMIQQLFISSRITMRAFMIPFSVIYKTVYSKINTRTKDVYRLEDNE